ncbi:uncharacterized protein LOC105781288 [Gossypium raimondii]|uniref:uncharacterized protein LOC105781288 n=1 Tax=Gossypium raimondii TaxID=29730 RepID=UPI00063AED7C|nr:uncharacterized protein LOC105781288 [Gossypium raimondii]
MGPSTHKFAIPGGDCCSSYVTDYVNCKGDWEWGRIVPYIDHQTMINIASASPPSAGSNPDICLWRDKANGICSAALAYDRITGGSWKPKDKKWKNVWKIRGVVQRSTCRAKWYNNVANDPDISYRPSYQTVTWSRPPHGVLKINTDGAPIKSSAMASAGEVVRDDKGDWISGFSRSLGVATVLHSELWAILDGLNLAWDRGFRKIILESDSKEAIDIINNGSDFLSTLALVIIDESSFCSYFSIQV